MRLDGLFDLFQLCYKAAVQVDLPGCRDVAVPPPASQIRGVIETVTTTAVAIATESDELSTAPAAVPAGSKEAPALAVLLCRFNSSNSSYSARSLNPTNLSLDSDKGSFERRLNFFRTASPAEPPSDAAANPEVAVPDAENGKPSILPVG